MMSSRIILSLLSVAIICFVFPSGVVGHAKLVSPMAWNPAPSKTPVCGTSAAQSIPSRYPATYVDPTQKLVLLWVIVVGDGAGTVSASIDTTAKNNPAASDFKALVVDANNPQRESTTPYQIGVTIPANTVCTGPGATCTLRVQSRSDWFACATITLTKPTQAPPPTLAPTRAPTLPPTQRPTAAQGATIAPTQEPTDEPTDEPTNEPTIPPPPAVVANFAASPSMSNPCMLATGLQTCSSINGQSIQLMGPSLSVLDSNVQDQITLAFNNPAVLTTPNVAGCQQAFTDFICAQSFPPCQSTAAPVCKSTCLRVNNLCKPNATLYEDGSSHASLYACDNIQLGLNATIRDTTGYCPNVQTGIRPTDPPTRTPTRAPRDSNRGIIQHAPITIIVLTMIAAWIVPHL